MTSKYPLPYELDYIPPDFELTSIYPLDYVLEPYKLYMYLYAPDLQECYVFSLCPLVELVIHTCLSHTCTHRHLMQFCTHPTTIQS